MPKLSQYDLNQLEREGYELRELAATAQEKGDQRKVNRLDQHIREIERILEE